MKNQWYFCNLWFASNASRGTRTLDRSWAVWCETLTWVHVGLSVGQQTSSQYYKFNAFYRENVFNNFLCLKRKMMLMGGLVNFYDWVYLWYGEEYHVLLTLVTDMRITNMHCSDAFLAGCLYKGLLQCRTIDLSAFPLSQGKRAQRHGLERWYILTRLI